MKALHYIYAFSLILVVLAGSPLTVFAQEAETETERVETPPPNQTSPVATGTAQSAAPNAASTAKEINVNEFWTNFMVIFFVFAILSLIIERSLHQIFDSKLWAKVEEAVDRQFGGDYMDLKPWIAIAVSILVVFQLELDMVAMSYVEQPHPVTLVITGLFIAGGSKGIYKFLKQARKLKAQAAPSE